jgi:hypothetical protein
MYRPSCFLTRSEEQKYGKFIDIAFRRRRFESSRHGHLCLYFRRQAVMQISHRSFEEDVWERERQRSTMRGSQFKIRGEQRHRRQFGELFDNSTHIDLCPTFRSRTVKRRGTPAKHGVLATTFREQQQKLAPFPRLRRQTVMQTWLVLRHCELSKSSWTVAHKAWTTYFV